MKTPEIKITDNILDIMYNNLKEQKPDLTDEALLKLLADVLRYTGNSKKRGAEWYNKR